MSNVGSNHDGPSAVEHAYRESTPDINKVHMLHLVQHLNGWKLVTIQ